MSCYQCLVVFTMLFFLCTMCCLFCFTLFVVFCSYCVLLEKFGFQCHSVTQDGRFRVIALHQLCVTSFCTLYVVLLAIYSLPCLMCYHVVFVLFCCFCICLTVFTMFLSVLILCCFYLFVMSSHFVVASVFSVSYSCMQCLVICFLLCCTCLTRQVTSFCSVLFARWRWFCVDGAD